MKTKKFQKNIKKFGKVLKNKLKRLMVAKKLNMGNIKKNRFESNDNLPLNKPIKLRLFTMIIRCVISEDRIKINVHQKNVSFVTIGFLKILDLNLKNMFVINVIIY